MLTGQEDPMLTTKKIACVACAKPVYKIDGLRAPHNAWNNPAATTIYKMDQNAKSMKNMRNFSMSEELEVATVDTKASIFQHPSRKTIDVSPKHKGRIKRPSSAERARNLPFTQRVATANRPGTAQAKNR